MVVARAIVEEEARSDVQVGVWPSVFDAGREAHSLRRLQAFLPTTVFERAFRKRFGLDGH